jgi:hypothetical protein
VTLSWTWRSCERSRCIDIVCADSQSPVSAADFYFTRDNETARIDRRACARYASGARQQLAKRIEAESKL